MNDILQRIKAALSCRDAAEHLGIDVPRKGDAACPKHHGKSLRLRDDFFYCHGGCAESGGKGDVIQLVQWAKECDFREAVEYLGSLAGIPVQWSEADQRAAEQQRKIEDVLEYAAAFFQLHVSGSAAAAYIAERGWTEIAENARLGYAPDTWDAFTKSLREAGYPMELAVDAGLICQRKDGSYYDHFRHRLIIPFVERGRVIYLQARSLGAGDTTNGDPKYLNVGRSTPPLYHLNGALHAPAPILTESTSDVLTFAARGHLPALGAMGANVQPQHLQRLRGRDLVYAAIHNDAAGSSFVDALALALGETLRIVPPPEGCKDWDEALTAGQVWQPDDQTTWLRWKLRSIPENTDTVLLRKRLAPLLDYLAHLDDEAAVATNLEELRRHFGWKRDVHQAYAKQVREQRARLRQLQPDEHATVNAESDALGETVPPPTFLSPALAIHNGVVYLSHKMAYKSTRTNKKKQQVTTVVWKPVLLSSDRRRIIPTPPPEGADLDSVWWLDEPQGLALLGGLIDAPERRWSYGSIVTFLNGSSPVVRPCDVYDALLASLQRYVYHAEASSYVVDVLWTMGTYFYRLWNAYPYLALHGERGAGKTTLLTWLHAVCFNAEFVVNTSEASLYRSIQAKAPTLLIDEQEGLNSSKAAKETKADLMGILKSGYKAGARVARQRMDRPDITEYFDVYSPKALAAIELFEDVLENRAILTFMTTKPADVKLDDDGSIIARDQTEFAALRDQLYLLLMQESQNVMKITERSQFEGINRFREMFRPLFAMAALVDASRGQGRATLDALTVAAEAKAKLRHERDQLSPEAMLREALAHLCADAWGDEKNLTRATMRDDGLVLCDTIQIKEGFEALFSTRNQSFFNDQWLGKQAQKQAGMMVADPRRRRRELQERDPMTNEVVTVEKRVACYVLDPKQFPIE